jgi:hypothetical protein
MPTKTINQDNTDDIDLGNSNSMTITAVGGSANVHVDYKLNGSYSSAIKGSAGYGNPFTISVGQTKVVNKSDLESENVRVGARNANIKVTY